MALLSLNAQMAKEGTIDFHSNLADPKLDGAIVTNPCPDGEGKYDRSSLKLRELGDRCRQRRNSSAMRAKLSKKPIDNSASLRRHTRLFTFSQRKTAEFSLERYETFTERTTNANTSRGTTYTTIC